MSNEVELKFLVTDDVFSYLVITSYSIHYTKLYEGAVLAQSPVTLRYGSGFRVPWEQT